MAAGEGSRMRSTRPKPLHMLCGRPMLLYVLDALAELRLDRVVVVVGHGAERVTKKVQELADLRVEFVEQPTQRGTGDALSVALTAFPDTWSDDEDLVVLPGDTPLLRPATMAALVARHGADDAAATVLTTVLEDPTGYGRVVRGKDGRVLRIVEQRDATDEERAIREVNTSIYCFRRGLLAPALRRTTPDNAQGEYYLTDVVEVLASAGYMVDSEVAADAGEAQGVNDRLQLAVAEATLRERTNRALLAAGVTMVDPSRTYVDATVRIGPDVTLFPGTLLQGRTVIGEGAEIGPDAHLVDTVVGAGAVVEHSVAHDAEVGAGAHVGPYAVLQPGAEVAAGEATGPFYAAER
jgi:bifunctional UDP-N-acetylglucosamine pyrophosphorylase/glucosamine-1-phosphate N-acetyltransferase